MSHCGCVTYLHSQVPMKRRINWPVIVEKSTTFFAKAFGFKHGACNSHKLINSTVAVLINWTPRIDGHNMA